MATKPSKSTKPGDAQYKTKVVATAPSGAKTSGIKVRGGGAATKGTTARGPMA